MKVLKKIKTKKTFKTLASVFLLAVLVLGCMPQTVLAAETYTITIDNDTEGHTYSAYQIFTGDYKAGEGDAAGTLSNIDWGTGLTADGKTALAGELTAAEYAESIVNANARELAEEMVKYLASPYKEATAPNAEGKYVITELPAGYYLVTDTDTSIPEGEDDGISAYIIQVVDDVDVTPKTGVPTLEKTVEDADDSTGDTTTGKDSADYDIGDEIPFTLTATLPSDEGDAGYQNFKAYYLQFSDTLSDGLDLNAGTIKVYVNSVTEDGSTLIAADQYLLDSGDHNFTLTFSNLKTVTYGTDNDSIEAGDEIIVTYTATLNENAKVGAEGNENAAKLVYLRDPNSSYDGVTDDDGDDKPDEPDDEEKGETPDDTAIVFTYELLVEKIMGATGEYQPLTGAEFALYKVGGTGAETIEQGGKTYNLVEETTGSTGSTFTFTGLGDGEYLLVETKTPDGYNTIEPIAFTVSATHTDGDTPELETLTVTPDDAFKAVLEAGTIKKMDNSDKTLSSGQIYTEVVNNAGATLPVTGGIGTTVFYILGGVCVVAASVLLVTKRIVNKKNTIN